jgi:hypothetical protein
MEVITWASLIGNMIIMIIMMMVVVVMMMIMIMMICKTTTVFLRETHMCSLNIISPTWKFGYHKLSSIAM